MLWCSSPAGPCLQSLDKSSLKVGYACGVLALWCVKRPHSGITSRTLASTEAGCKRRHIIHSNISCAFSAWKQAQLCWSFVSEAVQNLPENILVEARRWSCSGNQKWSRRRPQTVCCSYFFSFSKTQVAASQAESAVFFKSPHVMHNLISQHSPPAFCAPSLTELPRKFILYFCASSMFQKIPTKNNNKNCPLRH